jgi:hypothetical protein
MFLFSMYILIFYITLKKKRFTGEDLNMISHMYSQLITPETVWQHFTAFNLLNDSHNLIFTSVSWKSYIYIILSKERKKYHEIIILALNVKRGGGEFWGMYYLKFVKLSKCSYSMIWTKFMVVFPERHEGQVCHNTEPYKCTVLLKNSTNRYYLGTHMKNTLY